MKLPGLVGGALLVACGAPTTAGSDEALVLARDFSKAGSWRFDYRQDMKLGMQPGEATQVATRGELALDSKGDHTAKATLTAELKSPDGTAAAKPAPLEFTVGERAELTPEVKPERALTALLLPLPSKPLRVGERDTRTFVFPVDIQGQQSGVSGPLTLTFTGYDTVNGRRCANISSTLRIDETVATSKVRVHVDGTACVDVQDTFVIKSKLVIDLAMVDDDAAKLSTSMGGTLELTRK
jgi:hypothetical protein